MKNLFSIIVFAILAPSLSHASLWTDYGQDDKLIYQTYNTIPFDKVLPLPIESVVEASKTKNTTQITQCYDDVRFEMKLLEILRQRGIDDLDQISSMTVRQVLDLTFSIVGKQIEYRFVRDGEKLPGYANPSTTDCFVEGCGVCVDYASSVEKVFNIFKKHHSNLVNILIGQVSGDLYVDSTEKLSESDKAFLRLRGVSDGMMTLHSWNFIVVRFPDKAIYSFFNITSCYQCHGEFSQAFDHYGWSKFESLNKARLYESLGEYEPACYYFKKFLSEFSSNKAITDEKRIELYLELGNLAFTAQKYDQAYQYYVKRFHFTHELEDQRRVAEAALRGKKYALSLFHFKELFEKSEEETKYNQLEYLWGIKESLTQLDQLESFDKYKDIATTRGIYRR